MAQEDPISYSIHDRPQADAICNRLVKVFVAGDGGWGWLQNSRNSTRGEIIGMP